MVFNEELFLKDLNFVKETQGDKEIEAFLKAAIKNLRESLPENMGCCCSYGSCEGDPRLEEMNELKKKRVRIERSSGTAYIIKELGVFYKEKGKLERAREIFKEALEELSLGGVSQGRLYSEIIALISNLN
ncbi:hypothetical protein ACPWSR_02230 [Alloiococcus sp. CFN-8]|uniref:hypothetical protein n=1 Tax=Alloiococcus sp. CFN-8 TaxID=3416081 RepID=UPI003CEFF98D